MHPDGLEYADRVKKTLKQCHLLSVSESSNRTNFIAHTDGPDDIELLFLEKNSEYFIFSQKFSQAHTCHYANVSILLF